MRKFFAIATAVLLSIVSANAQYKMKVIQDDGSVSEFVVSKIKEVIWEKETHEWVDLGLPSGTKWATCNVGANSPEEYGDYYAWGETETKSYYDWSTYKLCNGSDDTMNKYCNNIKWGTVDNKTVLDPEDDVAHVKWGGSWRMPTDAELTELKEKCKWIWTSQNGTSGYKVISNITGNYIFLPAAGCRSGSSLNDAGTYGYYWSASLIESYPGYAWNVSFSSSDVGRGNSSRYYGLSVRPVCP